MATVLFFLSSGLFLGWSLGANDAANVFGTAVGTKMMQFRTAAIVCSVFVLLGAVISGAGASHTLGKLGAVNALGGSFTVALAAALTVLWMTKAKLPVSTSQAIVGAIVGWNFFAGALTDVSALGKIVLTWVICPILAGVFAYGIYWAVKLYLDNSRIHMFRLDAYTRMALFVAGAFGSYSLGANNIANVMGVFVPVSPFRSISIGGFFDVSSSQQLFFFGAIAIGVGVFTYSRRVMETVGGGIFKLSPISAFIVVLSSALVLYLFASQDLQLWLRSHDLPTWPLVPVSSSQAVVGAVLGIGLAKSGRNINFGILGKISVGWVITPVIAGIVAFFSLFFMQNVFSQKVFHPVGFSLSSSVVERLEQRDVRYSRLEEIVGEGYEDAVQFDAALRGLDFRKNDRKLLYYYGELRPVTVEASGVNKEGFAQGWLSEEQVEALRKLASKSYTHRWQIVEALGEESKSWQFLADTPENAAYNKRLKESFSFVFKALETPDSE